VYYERCTRILADIQDAEAEVGVLQASPRGLLRIAVPVTFGVLHVAPAVSDYITCYPEIRIDIVVSDRFVNLIEEGFEVAIRVGELQDSGLIARRLA
jgi:DNA-binding transcriptional LysR family regulator